MRTTSRPWSGQATPAVQQAAEPAADNQPKRELPDTVEAEREMQIHTEDGGGYKADNLENCSPLVKETMRPSQGAHQSIELWSAFKGERRDDLTSDIESAHQCSASKGT